MNIKIIIYKIICKFYYYFASPYTYAKFLGVNIGKNNYITKDHWSSEPYLITIGNNCQLTTCKILTHGGGKVARFKFPDFDSFGKVVIEDNAYVGANALIMPGVTIGKNSLIAAGSVVTKSVPPFTVVAGNPARVLCSVDDYINKNEKYNIHTKGLDEISKKKILLSLSDELLMKK